MSDTLADTLPHRRRRLPRRARHRPRVEQIRLRPLEPEKSRRIEIPSQIDPHRPHRRPVPNAEPDGVHHIVVIAVATLLPTKRHVADTRIYVAHIVKEYAADIVAQQRKT